MIAETLVPKNLLRNQMWFGSIVRMPIDADSQMSSLSPTGKAMVDEAAEFILPSPTLQPSQRIQIYCQQYWWRLLSSLHEIYPFLTCLFGYSEFNQGIGIPYLEAYPPKHWSLNHLGDHLPEWIENNYHGADKTLVFDSAMIDWAYHDAFIAPKKDIPPTELDPSKIFHMPLLLQPYVHLFPLDADLFFLRDEFLKHDPDYWLNHDFPKNATSGDLFYVLYRDKGNDIVHRNITVTEFVLLDKIQKGCSLEDICRWVEGEGRPFYEEVAKNLHAWIQSWIGDCLLAQK
jgi:hypothetical protein